MQSLLSELASLLPKIVVLVAVVGALAFLAWLGRKLYALWRLYKQDFTYLELTPPAWTDRMPEATQQLFSALYGIGSSRHWFERVLGLENSFSFELVSTRSEGIRYIVRVAEPLADGVEDTITAYIPDVRIKRTQGYFKNDLTKRSRIVSFRQAKHFAFPLKSYQSLSQQDPIGYITSAMTKLTPHELISMQLVFTPVKSKESEELAYQILNNEDLLAKLDKKRAPLRPRLFRSINRAIFSLMDSVGDVHHGPSQHTYYGAEHYSVQRELENEKQVANRIKPVRTLSYFETSLVESIHEKLNQPLFKTSIRLLLDCDTKQEAKKRARNLASAIDLLKVPKYQSLKLERKKHGWRRRYQLFSFTYRLPSMFNSSNLLSSSELASLYHFPDSQTAKTDNVVKSLNKTLPAPISLKNGTTLDILLGENQHHGSTTPIGLTSAERARHVYIIGGTGNGKTTMLMYGIIQDIQNGKGVAVLDPHGDLAESILRHIPKERIKDVIYLNPDDITHPIGVNLLELSEGLSGDELLREKDLVTESTISVMRKIFSEDDSGGHRIEYVLRNTIQTALYLENPTLFTIFDLLNDKAFRKMTIDKLEDKDLKNFWKNELGKAGDFQRVKMAAGITSKIGRFLFSASAKRILEQPKSTIDFDDILDSGKILICNFSKGLLGEDTSTLFGTTVLAKLQTASLRRARQQQKDRRPFFLYVDEFQNFATMSFVQMLSEARKYQLFLTMAEQSTSQQDQQRLVDIILANVGTVICFRSGSPADERYILPLFKPYIDDGEIANLPSFQFYMRIAAMQAHEPLSGITVLLPNSGDEKVASSVKESSRQQFAIEYKNEEKEKPQPTPTIKKGNTQKETEPKQVSGFKKELTTSTGR